MVRAFLDGNVTFVLLMCLLRAVLVRGIFVVLPLELVVRDLLVGKQDKSMRVPLLVSVLESVGPT